MNSGRLLALAPLFMVVPGLAQSSHSFPAREQEQILEAMVKSGETPGILYLVREPGRKRVLLARGFARLDSARRVDGETLFMLNSVTKAVTAIALFQLQEKELLSLEDPLSLHYSRHPYGESVTLRQLLQHTAGVPNPLPVTWLHSCSSQETFSGEEALQRVLRKNPKLLFPPGTKFRYSNPGYWLLGMVIEKVSGLTLEDYLQTRINQRVGNQTDELSFRIPPGRTPATGYIRKWSLFHLALRLMTESRFWGKSTGEWQSFRTLCNDGLAYGGLYGTGEGILRVMADLVKERPRLLSKESRDELFTRTTLGNDTERLLSPGFQPGSLQGEPYLEKSGGGPGFHSNVRIYTETGVITALFSNVMRVDDTAIRAEQDRLDSPLPFLSRGENSEPIPHRGDTRSDIQSERSETKTGIFRQETQK